MSLLTRLSGEEPIMGEGKVPTKTTTKKSSELERKLHNFLVEELKKPANQEGKLEFMIERLADDFFEEEGKYLTFEQKTELKHAVTNELTGYGPISPLLSDPTISEIMVNGPNAVYIEVNGRIEKTSIQFRDNAHINRVIEKIVAPLGRRIDESAPMVDARLPDGSRVNAIIPPLVLNGPTVTIRKFSEKPFTIYDLLRIGTLSENMANFLQAAVEAKLNIFISGGTGSGKTSTLNVLSSFIPSHERIVTIEDAAELKLSQEHVVSLEARPRNVEGQGEVSIHDLLLNSLRMRPDRIIIGEVRSVETLDMLQAMNTGHEGSLGTGHANSPRDLLRRLETMILMTGYDMPVRAIREQIAGALDLIVQQARMKDGSRRITRISEVLGLEENTIVLQDVFIYDENNKFQYTGVRPYCMDKFALSSTERQSLFEGEWQ